MFRICDNLLNKSDKFFNKYRYLYSHNSSINKLNGTLNNYEIRSITSNILTDIISYLRPHSTNLDNVVKYSFSASGKMVRPQIVILMAASLNEHFIPINTVCNNNMITPLTESQYHIALVAEMIHTASLMHDDLIDRSNFRRGIMSAHAKYGPEQAILGGDYVLIRASQLLAGIGSCDAVAVISELINDLIRGEIMQLTRYDDIDEKFAHYYKKTYRKTASLIANSCKAVCMLSSSYEVSEKTLEAAFEFGRNIGMTFQLVDDVLDVTASQDQLGKPGQLADLRLGLATGPILFASEKFPEVQEIVIRKLSKDGDLERILGFIKDANGVEQTQMVAKMHYDTAIRILNSFKPSRYRSILQQLSHDILTRTK